MLFRSSLAYEALVQAGAAATRQLAKRQLTWLRSEPGATWFDAENPAVVAEIRHFLQDRLKQSKISM